MDSAIVAPDLPVEVRYLAAACAALGLGFRDIAGDGYLIEVSCGERQVALAGGRACIYPTNSATAVSLSRDKMHTTNLLAAHDVPTLGGALFFLSAHHRQFRGPGREREDAVRYAEARGYPVFVKPNKGARGDLAEIVGSREQLERHLDEAATRYDAVLVQDVFAGDEYRVLVVEGRAVFAVKRRQPALVGDGRSTLRELLREHNEGLRGSGVSAVPDHVLPGMAGAAALGPDDVVAAGLRVRLPGRRNLAASGGVEEATASPAPALADLAVRCAGILGLSIAGVDLMDVSPGADLGGLRVVEINGAPGLSAVEQAGRSDLILDLWRGALSTVFGRELTFARPAP